MAVKTHIGQSPAYRIKAEISNLIEISIIIYLNYK